MCLVLYHTFKMLECYNAIMLECYNALMLKFIIFYFRIIKFPHSSISSF